MTKTHSEAPISEQEFDVAWVALDPSAPSVLGVSGGSDSLALMVLTARWAQAGNHKAPIVLTVDHGLRTEAAREAGQVKVWAQKLGLAHVTLKWDGPKPTSGLQAAARQMRYELMGRYCLVNGFHSLAVAHTIEDQAETLLLRLARGSGVDGLAAMAAVAPLPVRDPDLRQVRLFRPLLGFPRQRLRATLGQINHDWIEDPSNEDRQFARVRVRKLMPFLAREGLDAARLARTAGLMAEAREVLDAFSKELAGRCVEMDGAGFAWLDAAPLIAAPRSAGLRVLSGVLKRVAGNQYTTRLSGLERLYEVLKGDLREGGTELAKGKTLAGCRILPAGAHRYLIVREMRALNHHLAKAETAYQLGFGERLVWDNRFELRLSSGQDLDDRSWRGEVRPLGPEGWRQIKSVLDDRAALSCAKRLPRQALAPLPALWKGETLAAQPHLGLVNMAAMPKGLLERPRLEVRFIGD